MLEKTLREQCARVIADGISNGSYRSIKVKDAKASNLIFKMLREEVNYEWADCTKEIKNMLNVTEVCERPGSTILMDHHSVIHDQNLEVLKLGPLNDYPDFHTAKELRMPEAPDPVDLSDSDDSIDPDNNHDPYEVYHIDIIETLKKFLNPTSQKTLHTLCFDGNNMIFQTGWIKALSRLLPNLKTLELQWCHLGNKEFQSLCDEFPKLIRLDISNSGVTSLKGISKLKNLEFLDISYIKFKERKQIDDIFRLKKLRELLMHCGERKLKTVMLYVDCGKVLPKLESLDCAMCKLDQEHLERLVTTHKKLQRVAIVGTNIHKTATISIPGREIELLTCNTISDCIDSLTYYWEFHVLPEYPLKEIYDRINSILLFETEKVTPNEFKDCLLAMCQDDPECALNRVQAIDKMTRDSRVDMFNDPLKVEVMECLLAIHNDLEEYEDLSPEQEDTLKILWRVLSNPRLRVASDKHEEIVRRYATRMLSRDGYLEPETAIYCFRTKMSETADEEMLANQDKELPDVFFSSVLRILNQKKMKLIDKEDLEYLRKFLVYLGFRYYGREVKLTLVETYKCIKYLWKLVTRYNDNRSMKGFLLMALIHILTCTLKDTRKVFFKEDYLVLLTNELYKPDPPNQTKIVHILFYIYYHYNRLCNYDGAMAKALEIEERTKLSEDILKSLEGFYQTEHSGYLDGFSWIMTHCRRAQTEKVIGWFFEIIHGLYGKLLDPMEEDEDEDEMDDEDMEERTNSDVLDELQEVFEDSEEEEQERVQQPPKAPCMAQYFERLLYEQIINSATCKK
ncbi:hypothetical protein CAEBREN_03632 [Caenorhabditis brenneri]|uniref:Uncharacterized protein n=1 Tax=Caenorhabditis brenneri TaxID=135651 RepID=G0MN01_CAEBE|nr:hypothetical protein CAEBREN_03632 [Caenorhabditis brenneri]